MVAPRGSFSDVVDAIEALSPEEQREIVNIFRQRFTAREQQRLLDNDAESLRAYEAGECRVMTVDEIMREATS